MKHLIPKILIAQYIIAAVVYAFQKDWGRVTYWVGAVVIVAGTIMMK